MRNIKGRLISVIGRTGEGKSYLIADIINKK